jgi:hypothetical protein
MVELKIFTEVLLMMLTRLIIDIVFAISILSVIPKVIGLMIDVVRKLTGGLMDTARKSLKLDEEKKEDKK